MCNQITTVSGKNAPPPKENSVTCTVYNAYNTMRSKYTNGHLGTVCKISTNCVSCVVRFFYLLELTLKTQVSNTMNTVSISTNALFGNSANNFFEP